MRATKLAPVLALILGLTSLPALSETTAPTLAPESSGPKFVTPEITWTDPEPDPVAEARTLAEEILSAATLPEKPEAAPEVAEGPDQPERPAPSPEVVLAAATSGVNRVMPIVEELTRETIEVRVSISQQMMEVYYKGEMIHEWPVSTARKGKVTPKGSFKPQWLSKNHKSSLYNNAPMPYSIFYSGNYAIHGTDQESKLGRPASAGCVRLSRANAKILFAMVQQEGKSRMKVEILD